MRLSKAVLSANTHIRTAAQPHKYKPRTAAKVALVNQKGCHVIGIDVAGDLLYRHEGLWLQRLSGGEEVVVEQQVHVVVRATVEVAVYLCNLYLDLALTQPPSQPHLLPRLGVLPITVGDNIPDPLQHGGGLHELVQLRVAVANGSLNDGQA